MTMPNFLIIGAAKCGTSALYHYLRQHPEIYMSSRKETHFFAYEGGNPNTQGPGDTIPNAITDIDEYQALFKDVESEIAIGEASPTYIYLPRACENIHRHIPHVKIIAIVRQPVDRAYSAFMHLIRDNREPVKDFRKALAMEDERVKNDWGPIWHYARGGIYHKQLKRYFDTFPDEQIRVYLYDDFRDNPTAILRDIYGFLDLSDQERMPNFAVKPNVSGIPKSRTLQGILHSVLIKPNIIKRVSQKIIPFGIRWQATTVIRNWNLMRPTIDPDLRQELTKNCRDDIIILEKMIKHDLSRWLK